MATSIPSTAQILILGGGLCGCSSAYHLSLSPKITDIVLLDSGKTGLGKSTGTPIVDHASLRKGDVDNEQSTFGDNTTSTTKVFAYSRASGSAVYQKDPASCIKMIVNIFPCSSSIMIKHFGEDGAKNYLRLAYLGLELEKKLAKSVLSDVDTQLVEKGSLYVCLTEDLAEFHAEFLLLTKLGAVGLEWWDKSKTQGAAGPGFDGGMFWPNDAVIDSTSYCKGLLNEVMKSGKLRVVNECSDVVDVKTESGKAVTTLSDGTTVSSEYAVLATGGMFMERQLAGIIDPKFSYLVSIPAAAPASPPLAGEFRLCEPDSMNFFSWNFTHDWCLTKGHLRCSGEDHNSAFKPPRMKERCDRLTEWTVDILPFLKDKERESKGLPVEYAGRYGIYSETPDHTPLIGIPHPDSKVCYMLGCNAWGQASLSYCSSQVLKCLGYEEFTADEVEQFKLIDIKRYALLPCVVSCK